MARRLPSYTPSYTPLRATFFSHTIPTGTPVLRLYANGEGRRRRRDGGIRRDGDRLLVPAPLRVAGAAPRPHRRADLMGLLFFHVRLYSPRCPLYLMSRLPRRTLPSARRPPSAPKTAPPIPLAHAAIPARLPVTLPTPPLTTLTICGAWCPPCSPSLSPNSFAYIFRVVLIFHKTLFTHPHTTHNPPTPPTPPAPPNISLYSHSSHSSHSSRSSTLSLSLSTPSPLSSPLSPPPSPLPAHLQLGLLDRIAHRQVLRQGQ